MTETNVFQLSQPGTFADPLTEVLRNGARALLTQAVEAEVAALISCHADKLTDDGRQRLVRHGHVFLCRQLPALRNREASLRVRDKSFFALSSAGGRTIVVAEQLLLLRAERGTEVCACALTK